MGLKPRLNNVTNIEKTLAIEKKVLSQHISCFV